MEYWEERTNPKSVAFEFVKHLSSGGERLYDYMKRMNVNRYGSCSFCDYDCFPINDPIKAGCGKSFEIKEYKRKISS